MNRSGQKIITVVGARPQFIKAATVSRALREFAIEESIIHTGQHSDANMSDVFFAEMEIPEPKHFLGISGLTHGAMTGEMLKRIEAVLINEQPDAVLVYGDTNSTLAGSLAAAKLQIPVAHVEAGLRSFNMRMPEEINRILTDRVSKWLFCPTSTAVQNLSDEGIKAPAREVQNVGDVMFDATLHFKSKARWPSKLPPTLKTKPFALCTLHRQESIDNPSVFDDLLKALSGIARTTPIVWPVHPRAAKMLKVRGLAPDNIHMISPVGYLEMLGLLDACSFVATDSGGLQKEAYFFGKHCLTLRDETEWVELVQSGHNTLCGHDPEQILAAAEGAKPFTPKADLYGSGDAALKIAKAL